MSVFSDLKRIWSEHNFTSKIADEFASMLKSSEEMLSYTQKVLIQKSKEKKSQEKIYLKDKTINLTEQEIRKRILVHLTTNPQGNLPASLALISITKDAERIGDFVKNLFELNQYLSEYKDSRKLFRRLFENIGNDLIDLFQQVNTAFRNSDTKLALDASSKARVIARKCENIIKELVKSDYTAAQAVVLALGARYMKRIALHLSNIATSIYLPLPEMDYVDGKFKLKKK